MGSSLRPQRRHVPEPDRRAVGVLGRRLRALALVWMWVPTLVSREDLHLHPRSFASPLAFPACVYTVSLARLHFRPLSPEARAGHGRLSLSVSIC